MLFEKNCRMILHTFFFAEKSISAVKIMSWIQKQMNARQSVLNHVKIMAPAMNQIAVNVNMVMKEISVNMVSEMEKIKFFMLHLSLHTLDT